MDASVRRRADPHFESSYAVTAASASIADPEVMAALKTCVSLRSAAQIVGPRLLTHRRPNTAWVIAPGALTHFLRRLPPTQAAIAALAAVAWEERFSRVRVEQQGPVAVMVEIEQSEDASGLRVE
jgi:hypothetical protein